MYAAPHDVIQAFVQRLRSDIFPEDAGFVTVPGSATSSAVIRVSNLTECSGLSQLSSLRIGNWALGSSWKIHSSLDDGTMTVEVRVVPKTQASLQYLNHHVFQRPSEESVLSTLVRVAVVVLCMVAIASASDLPHLQSAVPPLPKWMLAMIVLLQRCNPFL